MVMEGNAIPLPPDITQRVVEFLRQHANTFVKWDLIRFFNDNPHAHETPATIAQVTGREIGEVTAALRELTQSGVLVVLPAHHNAHHPLYALVDAGDVRELVGAFVSACDDRDFRAWAIRDVIDGQANR